MVIDICQAEWAFSMIFDEHKLTNFKVRCLSDLLLIAGLVILFSARNFAWNFHVLCSSFTASLPG